MNKKELKNLAKKIAAAELILQSSQDSQEIEKAKNTIFELSGKVKNLDEITIIDELVQDILNNA